MDFQKRLQQFHNNMAGKADVAFFPISADLQYLTGIPRDIPNFGAVLHPGHWQEGAWIRPGKSTILTLTRMSAEFGNLGSSQGAEVRVLGDFDDPAELVQDVLKGFQLPDNVTLALCDHAEGETIVEIQKLLPNVKFVSGTAILNTQRAIKDEDEIKAMREAGRVTEVAFAHVLKQLRIGMTELEIIAEVDYQLKKHGSLGPSFTTSLYNSSPNHPLLFGQRLTTWKRELTAPVSILFDFGAAMPNGFCYDFGRTVSFGEPDEELVKVHKLVMESQRAGIAALKAGAITCAEVDAAARSVIIEGGYGEEFRHRLGHGIGMDVHEAPFLTKTDHTPVVEGMMFTIEPSITQFNTFSARVEDVVVARPNGGEPLTTGHQNLIVVD